MKPTIKTTALAILISLGTVACGSSGGGSNTLSTNNNSTPPTDNASTETTKQIAAIQKAADEKVKAAQDALTAANKKIAESQNNVTKLTQQLAAADKSKKDEVTKLEKSLADEKTALEAVQKNATDLQNQLNKFKEENPTVGYAFDYRVRERIDGEPNRALPTKTLDGLLQPAATEEERLRKFLFAQATSGLAVNNDTWQTYNVDTTANGKAYKVAYQTYHYNDGEAYLALIAQGNNSTIDGKNIRTQILMYGGNPTPESKFEELKKLDAKKTYQITKSTDWLSHYNVEFTADFGKGTMDGTGKKVGDTENKSTGAGDIVFAESSLSPKNGIIAFEGELEVEFMSNGVGEKEKFDYQGMMISSEAEKIVGRAGGSLMLGNEKK